VWEWPSGKELQVLRDHSDAVMKAIFAPDGKALYTASHDKNVRRFNLEDGKLIRTFTGHNDAVMALALSPDGKALVSAGTEPRLRWWNPEDGNTTRQMDGHGGPVNDIVFSKDGKVVASAGGDKRARIWDAGSGGQQRELPGSEDWVYVVAISPDGKLTAGGGADGVLRLWETANGRLRLMLLAWPPDGKQSKLPEWTAVTPEGYFEASAGWLPLLRPTLADKPVAAPRLKPFFASLRQSESLGKAWQSAALEAAKLPEPPATPPVKPAATKANSAPAVKTPGAAGKQ
jgi:WD40 repeat protein